MTGLPTIQDVEKYILSDYESRLRYATEALENNKKHIESSFLFMQEAQSLGLELDLSKIWGSWRMLNPEFAVNKTEDWRIIHQLVGKLEQYRVEPATEDARKPVVRVYLKPKDKKFNNITFTFLRKLHVRKDKDGKKPKCKLKRVTTSRLELVCDV